MQVPRCLGALAYLGLFCPIFHLQAAEVVGHLSTDQGATLSGQGLAVTLSPRQDYPVFSGDRVHTGLEEGSSVLAVPGAGNIMLSPDTLVRVERSQDRLLLDVRQGQVGFDLTPGAPVFLVTEGEPIHLAGQTGKGGVSVAADGSEGYLVLVDAEGGTRITVLATGETVYQGGAAPELVYAQVGAAPAEPAARRGLAWLPSGGAGVVPAVGAGSLPLVGAALVAALAIVDQDPSVFRGDRPTEAPTSPVRP